MVYDSGMRITTVKPTNLWDAARHNDVATINEMLQAGADIEAVDPKGFSPLMLAVYSGSREASHILLVRGANPNGRDKVGNTPLMGACFKGYVELVELLLECGADASLKNQSGADALQLAQMFGQEAIVAVLTKPAS